MDDEVPEGGEEEPDDSSSGSDEEEFSDLLHTPVKRKLRTTSRYIFDTLFTQGRDSDVTVEALGKEWRLHKLYLEQSAYFASMFSGCWAESAMDRIRISVPDDNVTVYSMETALGSLYRDEIRVEAAEVVPILAAASLLQLQGLIDQCVAIMQETVNVQTVVRYHDSAITYGLPQVQKVRVCQLPLFRAS